MSKNTLARYTMVGNWAVKDVNGKAYIGREVDNFITCQNGKIRSLEADLEVMDNRVAYLNAHNKDLAGLLEEYTKESKQLRKRILRADMGVSILIAASIILLTLSILPIYIQQS